MSSADIDALAGTYGALRLEVDFLDVVVAADGTPYVSLVDGCTAEEGHSRLGQGIVGHLVSGPPLVRTVRGRGLRAPIQLVRLARGRSES